MSNIDAVLFTGKGEASLTHVDIGTPPSGHALIKIKASGLCHTDIDVLHARYGDGAFPVIPGHEFAGEVIDIASDVKSVRIGARVAVDPNLPCGQCEACGRGLTNLCSHLKAYGVSHNGGFAQYSAVRADHLHDIGDLDFHVAALAEPLACVLNGLGVAGLHRGGTMPRNALVFGAGPIGMLLALTLKAEGALNVTIADINESRLEFAKKQGLRVALSGSDELAKQRHGFDFVADATGIPQVAQAMIDFLEDGGTALFFGVCAPDARISISPFEIFRRQLKLVGSHSLNRNIAEALAILKRDDGAMASLITHRLTLAEVLPLFTNKPTDPATMKVHYSAD